MKNWLAVVLTGALAITTIVLVGILFERQQSMSVAAPRPATTYTFGPSEAPKPRLAVIGDSWASGAGADPSGPPNSYAGTAADILRWPREILAGGGTGYTRGNEQTGPFGDRVQQVIDYKPDIVVVQGSSNDYLATEQTIEAAANDVFSRLRTALPDAKIIAMGMIDSPSSPQAQSDVSRKAVAAAAAANGVTFLDANAEGWLNIETDFADGYHPNNEGHRKAGERLAAFLQDLA